MDGLREQINDYLEKLKDDWDEYLLGDNPIPITCHDATDQILTIFQDWLRKEIEKMEVIPEFRGIEEAIVRLTASAQVNYDKKSLFQRE